MSKKSLTNNDLERMAKLAQLPLSRQEKRKLLPQLSLIIKFVSKLQKLDTKNVQPTSQVTGLVNVFREDKVETQRMLSQQEALKNAPSSYKAYFKVPAIFQD